VIAEVRVLDVPAASHRAVARSRTHGSAGRVVAFAALGLYGVLRWGTMLRPDPVARLFALLALAIALAAVGALPRRIGPVRRAWIAAGALVLVLVVTLAASGVPLTLLGHVRIALIARRIGHGIDGLPGLLVPYAGPDRPLREVILMGAGVLLLDGAAMLAFAGEAMSELRLAVAALPLLVLALVPAQIARPALPYLQGAVMFLLVAAFVLGGRIRRHAGPALALPLIAATTAGMLLAPAIDPHRAWVNFNRLAGELAFTRGERFDWSQGYGPLRWPAAGTQVLAVSSPRALYWKAQDESYFDGTGWTNEPAAGQTLLGVSSATLRRYTSTVTVRDVDLRSAQVIAAGTEISAPTGLGSTQSLSFAGDIWLSDPPLHPGETYTVSVYEPTPPPAALRSAGTRYPQFIRASYLTLQLPLLASAPGTPAATGSRSTVRASLAPFGRPEGGGTAATLQQSPYARAYALARRLASGARTPYAFAQAVERYLSRGLQYTTDPPPARYPIEAFLFATHAGYCQQFAGAMALLLRLGGVPARVASGFTAGVRGRGGTFDVSDVDAHSWVEAWFPGYGWVTFDPTPAGPSGDGLPASLTGGGAVGGTGSAGTHAVRQGGGREAGTGNGASAAAAGHGGSPLGAGALAGIVIGALLVLALPGLVLVSARRRSAALADPVLELERAFARAGRPLAPGTTLAALERRLASFPDAVGYVRALRLQRFAPAEPGPTRRQRRALRHALALGAGPLARLRALWWLPPRRLN
jgi:hypothetical protein